MVIDALLATILRGEHVGAADLALHDPEAIVLAASNHDIVPLVAERLAARPDVPQALAAMLRERANRAVAADMLREMELKRFLAELAAASIGSLIIKGSHLAYSHYPRPDLRPRVDSDVLIQAGRRQEVHDILTARLGYEAISKVFGEFVAAQRLYIAYRDGAIVNAVDIHWKVSSPVVFADVMSYDELLATSVPLPGLGPGARGPSDVHALLISCIHRVAHHRDRIHLKWLYDIDLLARGFSPGQWQQFAALATNRKVVAVCRRSLERAAYWFRTEVPIGIWSEPSAGDVPAPERSAAYLTPRPKAQMVADDFRALPAWRDRAQLLWEHLCPSADYMRRVYAPTSTAPLPALYLVRIVRGAFSWVRLP